jgi:pSer/pThr/pTyr-binding forkhead associated (FHA) protein
MSERILVVKSKGSVEKFPLTSDRLILGRDKKCDVYLEDSEISRKHIAILNKFGVIYVENISSTGTIELDGKPIEFAELAANQKVTAGPYTIYFEEQDGARSAAAEKPLENIEALSEEPVEVPVEVQSDPVEPQGDAPLEENENQEASIALGEPENGEEGTAALLGNLQVGSGDDPNLPEQPEAENNSLSLNVSSEPSLGASGVTQIAENPLPALIKMTKGDLAGQEFKLENGVEWSIGRGSKNEIVIDSQKISRQHFKIARVGPGFRIFDLGSSNGTKVNGVAVSDSPLSSFDTIQAGQIEFQFLIGNPEAPLDASQLAMTQNTGSVPANLVPQGSGIGLASATQASPNFSTSARMGSSSATQPGFVPQQFPLTQQGSTRFTRLELTGAAKQMMDNQRGFFTSSKATKPASNQSLIEKFKSLSPQRRVLLVLVVLIGIGALFQAQNPDSNLFSFLDDGTTNIQIANPQTQPNSDAFAGVDSGSPVAPLAQSPTVPVVSPTETTPEWNNLTDQEKIKIEELYQKALKAQNDQDWKTAYDSATQVSQKLKKYKNTNDIIYNSQSALNDASTLAITQSASSLDEAKANNAELISFALEAGDNALKQKNWIDAAENFKKVLVLDPDNKAAQIGFARASEQDAALNIDPESAEGREIAALETGGDPDFERKEIEKDFIKSLKVKFQDARNRINASAFGRALRLLKDLERELKAKSDELNDAVRTPASVRNEVLDEARLLLVKVKEASDLARTQLLAEYQTQMTDAEEMIQNKQYAMAREVYDRILKVEPDFDDVREARFKLYSKMIVEARNSYQEALIYESVGDLDEALNGYLKAKELLLNVKDATAQEYLRKANERYERLKGPQL